MLFIDNVRVINYATAGYVSGHEVMHGVWRNGKYFTYKQEITIAISYATVYCV